MTRSSDPRWTRPRRGIKTQSSLEVEGLIHVKLIVCILCQACQPGVWTEAFEIYWLDLHRGHSQILGKDKKGGRGCGAAFTTRSSLLCRNCWSKGAKDTLAEYPTCADVPLSLTLLWSGRKVGSLRSARGDGRAPRRMGLGSRPGSRNQRWAKPGMNTHLGKESGYNRRVL